MTTTLAEICEMTPGFAFKSKDFGDYPDKVVKITQINPPTVNMENLQGVDLSGYNKEKLKKYIVSQGDYILAMTGATIGKIGRIESGTAYLNQRVLLFRAKAGVDPDFLYYVLSSRDFQQYIFSHIDSESAQPNISAGTIGKYVIDVPDITKQQVIGRMLRSIDEKRELNTQINNNLEKQALALFRHYFMVYEPYGGSAPSSWTAVSLDDVCVRITDGSHYSTADDPDAPYPMYSVKDMETYGFNSSSCKHITEEEFHRMQKNDCVPRLNDILVAKDGSYLKEIFICSEERDEAILSSIAIFRPDTEIIIPEILLYLLKQPSVRKDVGDNYVSGSALPRIVLKDFKKYSFLLPPMTEQSKIGSVLNSIRMQTKANIDEIQRLSALRDALLPRLMSGELDVSNLDL